MTNAETVPSWFLLKKFKSGPSYVKLRGKKIFCYHGELFSRTFFVFCRRLRCFFTNSRHVLLEKDVNKVKCMGLGQIKTFDKSDTSEFFHHL